MLPPEHAKRESDGAVSVEESYELGGTSTRPCCARTRPFGDDSGCLHDAARPRARPWCLLEGVKKKTTSAGGVSASQVHWAIVQRPSSPTLCYVPLEHCVDEVASCRGCRLRRRARTRSRVGRRASSRCSALRGGDTAAGTSKEIELADDAHRPGTRRREECALGRLGPSCRTRRCFARARTDVRGALSVSAGRANVTTGWLSAVYSGRDAAALLGALWLSSGGIANDCSLEDDSDLVRYDDTTYDQNRAAAHISPSLLSSSRNRPPIHEQI